MATLQEQYNSIKSGNGNKDQFLKHARNLFPEYFNQYTDFNTATNVLKSKQIINEAAGGVVTKGFDIWDWKKILAEEVKAEEKATSKEITDKQSHAYDNSDMKNADNVNFNEIMKGFYAEMRDEKNAGKTGDELKAMVVKNLAKDPLFYTKDGMFGTKGVGYTDEAPGLGIPKEPKGKYKASGYGDLDADVKIEKAKSNVQDSLGDREANTSNPSKVKEMEVTPKSASGVKRMPMPGAEKKMKLQEAMDQGPVSIKGKTGPTGGTQKIPRALFLDKEVINTINNIQPGSIKLISKPGDKRVYMYVSSFVKNALDELERGRSSREKLKKQSKLADTLADELPSAIRGKMKKEINPKMDSGLKMHYVDLNISPKKDKTGYWVLAKGESAPLVAENLVEQKLRSLIRSIIKEELTEESKYEDTMPKYRLGALKKLLDISIKDGSPQDVITNLQNAIQSLEKQSSVNEISPELFKRATDVSRERGQDRRTSSMGEAFFNKFKGRPLMGSTIVNVNYAKPQQGNYEEVIVKIESPSSVIPGETKFRYIYYDVKTDQWNIDKEITRADARILSLIAQHINPDTQYKSGGEGFQIKGY
jgi:hypothetical protein